MWLNKLIKVGMVAAGGLLSMLGKAQPYSYVSFPAANATWYGRTAACCPDYSYNWTNTISGDTVFGSYKYVTLQSDNGSMYYREDSLRRIFYRGINSVTADGFTYALKDTIDYLVYDFGKDTGDTITTNVPLGPDSLGVYLRFVVDDIDTVLIDNGYRKKFYVHSLHCNSSGRVWIEGIGSLGGFPLDCDFESLSTLICFKQDSTVSYWNGGYCILNLIDVDAISAKVFPNPASTHFTLQLQASSVDNTDFAVYDALGRIVKRQRILSVYTAISRDALPNGIYYWQVTAGGQVTAKGKLVLQ